MEEDHNWRLGDVVSFHTLLKVSSVNWKQKNMLLLKRVWFFLQAKIYLSVNERDTSIAYLMGERGLFIHHQYTAWDDACHK